MTGLRKSQAFLAAAVAVATALIFSTQSYASITLNFSSNDDSNIVFSSADPGPGLTGSFSFVNSTSATGPTFLVGSGGTGSAQGRAGHILGSYDIGAITTSVVTVGPVTTTFEAASVTPGASGPHRIEIYDGSGFTFQADVAWIDIFTQTGMNAASGTVNAGGSINLANLTYNGTNADLVTLAAAPDGVAVITFQFATPVNLTQLTTSGGMTSFSGSLTTNFEPADVVPEPGTVAMALIALPLMGAGYYVRRRSRA